MSIVVKMRSELDPVLLDGDFLALVNSVNVAAASGKRFMLTELESGESIALNIDNVNYLVEKEDSSDAFLA